ncbi:hypothetical protein AVEN_190602-1 [Araneus ventricosus]|uniref:Uncharacterized protein n=1 Tax=Araneus ventricosus TaxID=182803 RepID=A0A4Y2CCL7_ARAVE|nr:hypothetical protein AVEN_190602-1 [Araneus ventricosus]
MSNKYSRYITITRAFLISEKISFISPRKQKRASKRNNNRRMWKTHPYLKPPSFHRNQIYRQNDRLCKVEGKTPTKIFFQAREHLMKVRRAPLGVETPLLQKEGGRRRKKRIISVSLTITFERKSTHLLAEQKGVENLLRLRSPWGCRGLTWNGRSAQSVTRSRSYRLEIPRPASQNRPACSVAKFSATATVHIPVRYLASSWSGGAQPIIENYLSFEFGVEHIDHPFLQNLLSVSLAGF